MKTRFIRISRPLAAIFMVVSFVIPAGVATTSRVSADPGIMRWDAVMTPEAFPQKTDVDNVHYPLTPAGIPMGSEILNMAVGNDGKTIAWIVRDFQYSQPAYPPMYQNVIYWSNTSGITASTSKEGGLMRAAGFILGVGVVALNPNGQGLPANCYQVAIAPDNAAYMAVTADGTSDGEFGTGFGGGPRRIYVSSDSGNSWYLAYDGSTALAATEFIRNIDISIDYGGKRDIGFVTTTGLGTGRWFISSSTGFSNWFDQTSSPSINMPAGVGGTQHWDFYALKFSPTYNGDSSITLIAADGTGTYYNVAQRDLSQDYTTAWAFANSINVSSPTIATLNNAVLQLPSDFSGQSSSLRRAYISLDALNGGIYRIDDTQLNVLMANKSIYSIAYFGTYASGKLLAGERMGFPCTATVPTWFTDSPTICPIPCWYPALKATTGAGQPGIMLVVRRTAWGLP